MSARSPLKAKPLRNPGQGLDEQIHKLVYDVVIPFYLTAALLWLLAGLEWFATYVAVPRMPWTWTAMALGATGIMTVKVRAVRARTKALELGRDGEKAVAQYLDGLREHGARIFHDVPADGFNIDHIVISSHGILVVETKTLSKPSPDSKVTWGPQGLLVAGKRLERDPINQVRAQVDWVRRLIADSTGKSFWVFGAVVFPGWWVDPPPPGSRSDVWVLEPKGLPGFLGHEPVRLEASDVALAAYHLSRYIRTARAPETSDMRKWT